MTRSSRRRSWAPHALPSTCADRWIRGWSLTRHPPGILTCPGSGEPDEHVGVFSATSSVPPRSSVGAPRLLTGVSRQPARKPLQRQYSLTSRTGAVPLVHRVACGRVRACISNEHAAARCATRARDATCRPARCRKSAPAFPHAGAGAPDVTPAAFKRADSRHGLGYPAPSDPTTKPRASRACMGP